MPKEHQTISWPLAVALAVVAVMVAAVVLALVPNLLVSRLGAPRTVRVAVATFFEVAAFVGVAWGAVRLQRRGATS